MGTLNYAATVSLDGYAADRAGGIAWAAPDAEVFAFHLQRMREVTTEILGRRTYSMMQYWEDPPESEKLSSDETEFAARWKTLDKHVVSTTLAATQLGADRTRLLRELCLADIRRIVTATSGVVEIFGPTTAAEALRACLVDRIELFIHPTILGGGLSALPEGVYRKMRLEHTTRFANGTVYLRYVR